MSAEEWRPIAGFPDYRVSSLGRVVSYKRKSQPREIRGGHNQRGYRLVGLYGPSGAFMRRTVHRIVAAAFLGPTPDGMQLRHLDGDKENNAVNNLAFGTPSENMRDQVVHGVHNMARKTHCPRNHPYDEANTYVIPSSGGRMCRTCARSRYSAA